MESIGKLSLAIPVGVVDESQRKEKVFYEVLEFICKRDGSM